MSEQAKDWVRAAQQAEVSGDYSLAVEHLRRAAAIYRAEGNEARADQMLRQAERLGAKAPAGQSVDVELLVEGEEGSLSGPGETEASWICSDPAIDGWCSFCCRPRSQVGPLARGAAGAFICTGCSFKCAALLGAPDRKSL